jgi:cell division protein FtsQ
VGIKKSNTRKIITSIVWLLVGVACITLLVSAVYYKDQKKYKGLEIDIDGVNDNYFIDKNDVYEIVKNYGGDTLLKQTIQSINLKNIEKELEKNIWIKQAELYFDNNNILRVAVQEREPIARIFSTNGNSFYIDSSCKILPLSAKFSARLPVVTEFAGVSNALSHADSATLQQIKVISNKIYADTFLMAMIEQINILPNNSFEMIPKLGKQIIVFGDAENIDSKFESLKLFYKKVIPLAGWNKYSKINLQFKNQVVASIRGQEDIAIDSLRTLALIESIATMAAQNAADSTQIFLPDAARNSADSSNIEQSTEREDEAINDNASLPNVTKVIVPAAMPAIKPKPLTTTVKETIIKPVLSKPIVAKPTIPKPSVAKPTAQKPVVANPVVKKPTVVKPTTKPSVVKPKPKVLMPKPVKPKPSNDF